MGCLPKSLGQGRIVLLLGRTKKASDGCNVREFSAIRVKFIGLSFCWVGVSFGGTGWEFFECGYLSSSPRSLGSFAPLGVYDL